MMLQINYEFINDEITGIVNSWVNCNLSLVGKVLMLNSLIGSLFVHQMNVLLTIPDKIVNDICTTLRNYL